MNNLAEENKVVDFPVSQTASIQKEVVVADLKEGWFALPNTMMDALCQTKFSDQETRVFRAVIRKTYGYNKTMDWIASTQIVELTGISKRHVSTTIKKLVNRNILIKDGKNMGVNPVISEWQEKEKVPQTGDKKMFPKQVTKVTQIGKGVPQTGDKSHSNRRTQKNTSNTKDNITKNNVINSNNSQVSKSKKIAKQELDFSSWPSLPTEQVMTDWQALRKQKRAAISQTVINNLGKQFSEAAKHGFSVDDCLSEIVTRGWTGFKCEWLVKNNTTANYGSPKQAPDFYAGDISWAEDLGL